MEGALDIAAEIPMSSLILDLKAGDQRVVFQVNMFHYLPLGI